MVATTRGQARQAAGNAEQADESALTLLRGLHKTSKTATSARAKAKSVSMSKAKAGMKKGSASSSTSQQAKSQGRTFRKKAAQRTAMPVTTQDDQAGIIYPTTDDSLDNIAARLGRANATYKVGWSPAQDGSRYISCIWFKRVTQDTMAQLLASPDVKRAFFYNEEDERLRQAGVDDLTEGRGWMKEEDYDSDL